MASLDREVLDKKVEGVFDQVIEWRRHIHAYPELSYEEIQTTDYIESELRKLDPESKHLTVRRPIPNGIVADMKGTRGGSDKIILLRADTDALPVEEASDVSFTSTRKGVSHACGHDSHTAMLLGAVALLLREVDQIDGTVRFLFQPAEELPPGGMKEMIKAGCLEGVSMAFAEHVLPLSEAPTGTVLMRSGVMFNSADNFAIRVIGRGGHGSMPELTVDPVAISAAVVTALQAMVTRRLPSNAAPVLTVASIHSSTEGFNVIPDYVTMKGTIRCGNPEVRQSTLAYLEEVVAGVTASMGASYELTWSPGYSMCVNHPDAFAVGERVARQVLPSEAHIVYMPTPMKASEDFAFAAEQVPSNYVGIGCYNEATGCTAANHSTKFKIDEACFRVGVKMHYGIVHELLMR